MTTIIDRSKMGVTIVTPVSIDVSQLELRADCFKSPIDLALLRARYPVAEALGLDPLILKFGEGSHVVVLRFGAVVFWQYNEATCTSVLEEIQKLPEMSAPNPDVRDHLLILVDQPEEHFGRREIRLQTLSLEHIKIISETFGQSVALKQSELSVTQAMKNTAPIVHALETRGALNPSSQNLMKTVGFTLAVREAILAKLSLFDDPAEAWRSERLARLHDLLYVHFELKKRLASLKEKVTFLTDLNLMLIDLLQTRTSHRLEWIVIILIVLEVIMSTVHFYWSR